MSEIEDQGSLRASRSMPTEREAVVGDLIPANVLEAVAHNLCSLHGFDPAFVIQQERFARAVIVEYERASHNDFSTPMDGKA